MLRELLRPLLAATAAEGAPLRATACAIERLAAPALLLRARGGAALAYQVEALLLGRDKAAAALLAFPAAADGGEKAEREEADADDYRAAEAIERHAEPLVAALPPPRRRGGRPADGGGAPRGRRAAVAPPRRRGGAAAPRAPPPPRRAAVPPEGGLSDARQLLWLLAAAADAAHAVLAALQRTDLGEYRDAPLLEALCRAYSALHALPDAARWLGAPRAALAGGAAAPPAAGSQAEALAAAAAALERAAAPLVEGRWPSRLPELLELANKGPREALGAASLVAALLPPPLPLAAEELAHAARLARPPAAVEAAASLAPPPAALAAAADAEPGSPAAEKPAAADAELIPTAAARRRWRRWRRRRRRRGSRARSPARRRRGARGGSRRSPTQRSRRSCPRSSASPPPPPRSASPRRAPRCTSASPTSSAAAPSRSS